MAGEKGIEKLGENNYQHWAFQVKNKLKGKELWNGVILPRPEVIGWPALEGADNASVAAANAWDVMNQKAYNKITGYLDRANANLIMHTEDGREAWEILRNHHMAATIGNKMRTTKRLNSLKLGKGASMKNHLNDMLELFNKLHDLGDPMQEDHKIITILNSIEPEYSDLSTAIMAWSEERLTYANVKEKLVEEYEKRKDIAEEKRRAAVEGNRWIAPEEKCWNIAEENKALNISWRNRTRCYNCKELGHMRRDCPYPGRREKSKSAECMIAWDKDWTIDSGASKHMTFQKESFSELQPFKSDVVIANGTRLQVKGIGTIKLTNNGSELILRDVFWVPDLETNLMSVRELARDGSAIFFDNDNVLMVQEGKRIKIGKLNGGRYTFSRHEMCFLASDEEEKCVHQWHRIFAHRNLRDIKNMKKEGLKIISCDCPDDCEACIKGKMSRKPFPKENNRRQSTLDLVVTDVCGYMQTETLGRKKYFVTFIDDYSDYCEVKLLRTKDEVTGEVKNYVEKMKTQLGKTVKVLRSDKGTEYLNEELKNYLLSQGIHHQTTVGYCPEQNSKAERRNRTLMEAVRTMLEDAKLPNNHWGEALYTANYTQNRIVNKKTGKTPMEMMFGEQPEWHEMKRFGCDAYVMVPYEKRRKLDMKAVKVKFVGIDEHSKGYRLTDGRKIFVSRDVKFLEEGKIKRQRKPVVETYLSDESTDESDNEQETIAVEPEVHRGDVSSDDEFESAGEESEQLESSEEEEVALQQQPRRSTRANIGKRPRRFDDYVMEAKAARVEQDPVGYKQAVESADAEGWKLAMQEELDSIEANNTWELVDLPAGRKAVGSKWVYKTKFDVNGNIEKRKARLVAQGFSQKSGIDYFDVFAPVARTTTLRMMLSAAGGAKWTLKQYDVKSAFLNGKLEEEIFMRPPQGIDTQGKVYKLKKSLYGLKQAARVWNKMLTESLTRRGCVQNQTDKCLFSYTSGGEVVHLLTHVDDILAVTSSEKTLDDLMTDVGRDFELKSMGEATDYLGMGIERDQDGNFMMSQRKFIEEIIEVAGLSDAKTSRFPLDTGYHKLTGKELDSNDKYRTIIGMLLYLSTNTRPDIAASVAILSQRVTKPRDTDMNEAKRVIRYLKGTKDLKLKLSDSDTNGRIEIYSDSDWAEDQKDRKSHTGWNLRLNGGTVGWSCRKQSVVALSSAEAEYIAMSEAAKEVIWALEVAKQFGYDTKEPVKLFTDSQSAIGMAKSEGFSNRSKHIDTKVYFIKDLVDKGRITLVYTPTNDNIADLLTKPLGSNKIEHLRKLSGMN
jgi:hypothetical protein